MGPDKCNVTDRDVVLQHNRTEFWFAALPINAFQQLFFRHANARAQQDRKSTRLNSSHGYISYAVFCLKKKKLQCYLGPYSTPILYPCDLVRRCREILLRPATV